MAQQSMQTLLAICGQRSLPAITAELDRFGPELDRDLALIERALAATPAGEGPVEQAAHHLISVSGKRFRPMLALLAARLGPGQPGGCEAGAAPPLEAPRHAALAVELIHAATLLHDDVVDLGDTRRGMPAARMIYGNAASIFAGDWLIVHALRHVRAVPVPHLIDQMLLVIDEMILAESTQLARRGRIDEDQGTYFRVIEGKTASLFGFAAYAGGSAGGLAGDELRVLESFGRSLGIAFQIVDDILDFSGGGRASRKTLCADLREGKMTHPLMIALERDGTGELRRVLEQIVSEGGADLHREVIDPILARTDALEASKAVAGEHARRARETLSAFPPGSVRAMLELVVGAVVERSY